MHLNGTARRRLIPKLDRTVYSNTITYYHVQIDHHVISIIVLLIAIGLRYFSIVRVSYVHLLPFSEANLT